MSDFRIDKIVNRTGDTGSQIAGISTFSGTSGIQMPSGPTEYRGGRGRGIFAGGYEAPTVTSEIQTIEIATTGNGTRFGDLSNLISSTGCCGSSTRGFAAGGTDWDSPAYSRTTQIDYVVMSSLGGGSNFGDLTLGRRYLGGMNDSTRGVFAGGDASPLPALNTIDYITMASTGDATDFGNLGVNVGSANNGVNDLGSCSSPTRGFIFANGTCSDIIQFITIQTKGDSTKFGELTGNNVRYPAGNSSDTRALRAGGSTPSGISVVEDVIDYWTMASEGNATDFGNLTVARNLLASCSSKIRGVWAGGYDSPVTMNTMDYVTIASTGNAVDFGDLTYSTPVAHTNGAARGFSGCSDVNGGLG